MHLRNSKVRRKIGANPAHVLKSAEKMKGQGVSNFKAIVVNKADAGQSVALTEFDEAALMDGDVTFRVEWSTLNYKDGLAVTGKAPVVRRFPMIAGHRWCRHGRVVV